MAVAAVAINYSTFTPHKDVTFYYRVQTTYAHAYMPAGDNKWVLKTKAKAKSQLQSSEEAMISHHQDQNSFTIAIDLVPERFEGHRVPEVG